MSLDYIDNLELYEYDFYLSLLDEHLDYIKEILDKNKTRCPYSDYLLFM